jgi:hypothetical protein
MVTDSLPLLKTFCIPPHGEGIHTLKNILLYFFNGQAFLN